MKHVPGFIESAEELKSKGVDEILCISGLVAGARPGHKHVLRPRSGLCLGQEPDGQPQAGNKYFPYLTAIPQLHPNLQCYNLHFTMNDPFVMKAWAKTFPENKHVKFLADGSGTYTHALGLELDLSEKGLGTRSRRFALLVDDLKVKVANIEEGGQFTISGAEEILKAI
ncbi:hypothetical protein Taro_013661 [Colocasia esculenta]|uniref:Glutaredoxin-dependent peroxiredoxin n=1 Tax=Colocasia esculenta TaxID=4460 RepID=A0A843UMU3_COLES|nr:hypothetical protein [Colocasia esculenta]